MPNGTRSTNATPVVLSSRMGQIPQCTLVTWFSLTSAVSLISSCLILLLMKIIYSSSKSITGANKLILHLLLVNFLLTAFSNPIYTVSTYLALNKFPVHLDCSALMFVRIAEISLECCAELSLAVNRFVAIVFPTRYKWWSKNLVTWTMIVVSWIVALVPMIPSLFGYGIVYGAFPPLFSCTGHPNGEIAFPIAMWLGIYFPMAAVGTIYLTVLVIMRSGKLTESKQTRRKAMVAVMLFVSYSINLVCYVPMPIMVTHFPRVTFGQPEVLLWLVALQVVGYGANPVAFLSLSENYRKSAGRFLRRGCEASIEPTGANSANLSVLAGKSVKAEISN